MRTHLQHQTQEEVEVICTFFFREIIFHENFRVNATIKVEDSLCQRILRKCLNLFRCDEVLGETMSSKKQYLFSIKPCIKCF